MKELLQFLLGIVLMIAGGVMFLKNVVVSDWGLKGTRKWKRLHGILQ